MNLNPCINTASSVSPTVNVYIAVIQKEQGVTLHLQSAARPLLLPLTYYFPKITLTILFLGKR